MLVAPAVVLSLIGAVPAHDRPSLSDCKFQPENATALRRREGAVPLAIPGECADVPVMLRVLVPAAPPHHRRKRR